MSPAIYKHCYSPRYTPKEPPGMISKESLFRLRQSDPITLLDTCFDIGSGKIESKFENFQRVDAALDSARRKRQNSDFLSAVRKQMEIMRKGAPQEPQRALTKEEWTALNQWSSISPLLPDIARRAGQGIHASGSGALAQLRKTGTIVAEKLRLRLEEVILTHSCRNNL